jgi:hypothetical protein
MFGGEGRDRAGTKSLYPTVMFVVLIERGASNPAGDGEEEDTCRKPSESN